MARDKKKPAARGGELIRKADVEKLDRLTRELLELKKTIRKSFYRTGVILELIETKELYRLGGYTTFEAYLENEVQESRESAYQYQRVVRAFDEKTANALGSERLDAALRYLNATPEADEPKALPRLEIVVDDRGTKKRLLEASTREINRAAATARQRVRKGSEKHRPGASEAQRFLDLARAALDKAQLEKINVSLEPAKKSAPATLSVYHVTIANAWRAFSILAKAAKGAAKRGR